MTAVDSEQSFQPGHFIIGSDACKAYQAQHAQTWQEATAAVNDFCTWNQKAKDDVKVGLADLLYHTHTHG